MLYPINLDINNKLCAVVGGGKVAARKAEALVAAGARVKMISPDFKGEAGRAKSEEVEIVNRMYKKGDLKGIFLAVAATDNPQVNKAIAEETKQEKILLNIVDKPEFCDFFVPSVVKRGDLVISISTSGKFPALSKKLRKDLESEFGPEYEKYLELLAVARNKVIAKYADLSKREEILQKIAGLDLIRLIKQGQIDEAEEEINECI